MPSNSFILQVLAAAVVAALLLQAALWLISTARRSTLRRRQQQLSLELLEQQVETARLKHRAASNEVNAWEGFRKFVVARTFREGNEIRSIYLAPHDRKSLPGFRPGQHLTFKFHIPGDPKLVNRCYSLSDGPNPEHYRITVKRVPPPRDTEYPPGKASTFVNDILSDGDIIDIKAPKGDFFLDLSQRRPAVLIGGGVGITPFLSMLNALGEQDFPRETWLFYGVRNQREQVEREKLTKFSEKYKNFHLHVVHSDPSAEIESDMPGHHRGHIDMDLLNECLPSNNYEFYICGPPAMMGSVVPALIDWGVPKQRIRFEAFGPASIKGFEPEKAPDALSPPATGVQASIKFAKSGKSVTWLPEAGSLLELGAANGLHMESGCCAGECLTCEVALVSGKVRYLKEPSEAPDPGNCLPCVCVPQGDVEIDA